ncbi:damage-control phosphatase ARMT1 family protein [Streptomyces avicenniae]|uniref:damage-control phosphatase ARMT1 family protein n=1 Tax=Streptomyces avicenniae TaxID=500153 RepID=UPI001CBA609B|nr:damage-control phosphatase ARMT1 family protein [Streptomyces avicenniae]
MIPSGRQGSFPWSVFHERHPRLVAQVRDGLPYGPAERDALERLLAESTGGVLVEPGEDDHDRVEWLAWGRGLWGKPWGEAPFLWAESWFHRRLLGAVGWFGPGPWEGVDPFGPVKAAELAGGAVDEELAALDALRDMAERDRRTALVSSALWGNRADLGFGLTSGGGGGGGDVLTDDGHAMWTVLDRMPDGTAVALVADNAGRELLPDLVLIDTLLRRHRVVLHVKPRPYYVSDATMADVLAAVGRLRGAPQPGAAAVGRRLWAALNDGTLTVRAHAFFCAPLPFHAMPSELRADFAGMGLTLVKGDLNYRRLVDDRLWAPTTPFAEVAGWFPSPVVALRTLKSDVIAGLDARTVARLDASGESWRVNGRHALVQLAAPGHGGAGRPG